MTSSSQATRPDDMSLVWLETPLGPLLAGAAEEGICLLAYPTHQGLSPTRAKRPPPTLSGSPRQRAHLTRLADELRQYFAGHLRQFTVAVHLAGTPFQMRVWRELLRIPYGATRSYAEIAQRIGRPGTQRAVGRANGQNRIAIVIPCHRVVPKGGKLGGYSGGAWRKQLLLDLEQGRAAAVNRQSEPRADSSFVVNQQGVLRGLEP